MATIFLSEVRTQIENFDKRGNPIPFSISVVTYDRKKKTGGDIITFDCAIKFTNLDRHSPFLGLNNPLREATPRNPNHFKNQTVNLAILAKDEKSGKTYFTGNIAKIHTRLILEFNGREVIWD
jgi:hypothetical protein